MWRSVFLSLDATLRDQQVPGTLGSMCFCSLLTSILFVWLTRTANFFEIKTEKLEANLSISLKHLEEIKNSRNSEEIAMVSLNPKKPAKFVQIAASKINSPRPRDLVTLSHNISAILENLLKNYNNNIRPGYKKGLPTPIRLNIHIRSMGPISETDMEYSMDCYLRQQWKDDRLKFHGPRDELTLNIKMLEHLWKPDTYFQNGLGSYIHTITRPNKLFRIYPDGRILYSMRLTIKAKCPMTLRNFPMDKQSCPLVISSYAYPVKDVLYVWDAVPVSFERGMALSQFDILDTQCTNYSIKCKDNRGNYSVLQVNFNLQRHTGYFLIQVYIPCILIVVLSWVSFWINREATSDRVGLGITTVLTLSTISLDTRTDLPKVHYATALDWFILMSFGYCIATLLQFASVHFFTKVGFGESMVEEEWEDVDTAEEDYDITPVEHTHRPFQIPVVMTYESGTSEVEKRCSFRDSRYASFCSSINQEPSFISSEHACSDSFFVGMKSAETQTEKKESFWSQLFNCIVGNDKYRRKRQRQALLQKSVNSVSIIDKVSRILFPASYGFLNLWYWTYFYNSQAQISWTDPVT